MVTKDGDMEWCGALDPDEQRPRFSVVIPALDEAETIVNCLDSLAAQDFPGRVQVVVVDNGSTDATALLAESRGALVVTEPRRGVCFARQRGLEVAVGEIVMSTDADTTFAPGWLRSVDEQLRANPQAVGVAGPCVYVDGPRWSVAYGRLLFGAVAVVARTTRKVGYVSATNLAFRRGTLDGYDTRLTQGGDELDVIRRLQRRGQVLWDADNPTYTSARRLQRGLLYNVVVSLSYYYVLGYWVNRVAGHPVLGTAPPIRPTDGGGRRPRALAGAAVLTAVAFACGVLWYEDLL